MAHIKPFGRDSSELKVAIVHDWFTGFAGGEQVVVELFKLFPQSVLVTAVANKSLVREKLPNIEMRTSLLQGMPFIVKKHQIYIPFMPVAYESMDLKGFDLIISSGAFSKGIITHPGQIHINYNHTPIRYAWGFGGDNRGKGLIKSRICHYLRQWDYISAQRPDYIIANSVEVKNRINKVYRRDAEVINPPVNLQKFAQVNREENNSSQYITFGRLVDYKRVDLIVQAFTGLGDKVLHVVGVGPDLPRLQVLAQGKKNIFFHGRLSDEKLIALMEKIDAFIFAAEEDFGIAPIEALGAGVPVLAYGAGGALEYIKPGINGELFSEQSVSAIKESVKNFNSDNYSTDKIRQSVEHFDSHNFAKKIMEYISHLA